MFGSKKLKQKKEEELIKKEAEKRFPLKDLHVVWIGRNKETIHGQEQIIARYERNGSHVRYVDVLNNNGYFLYSDYYAQHGDLVAFNPSSLTSIFKDCELKRDLMEKGYATKEQLTYIYQALNNKQGIIYSNDKKEEYELPSICTILNNKEAEKMRMVGRHEELEKLLISLALNKKISLIVGNMGIGKTKLIDELAYYINEEKVPEFLQNKKIIEINISALKNQSEEDRDNTIKKIIEYASSLKAILYIDGIDEIYDPEKMDNPTLDQLKYEVERNNLKLIATTHKKGYKKLLTDEEFKKRFDVIEMKELSFEELSQVIKNAFEVLSLEKDINMRRIEPYLDDITTVLISSTNNETNSINSTEVNPRTIMSIINRSFATCIVEKEKELTYDHLIKAVEENTNMAKDKKEKAITVFKKLKQDVITYYGYGEFDDAAKIMSKGGIK